VAKLVVRYDLYPVGAVCDECGGKTVKRLNHKWPDLTVDQCGCGGYSVYQKLGWHRYAEWMEEGAKYIEIGR